MKKCNFGQFFDFPDKNLILQALSLKPAKIGCSKLVIFDKFATFEKYVIPFSTEMIGPKMTIFDFFNVENHEKSQKFDKIVKFDRILISNIA